MRPPVGIGRRRWRDLEDFRSYHRRAFLRRARNAVLAMAAFVALGLLYAKFVQG